MKILDRDFKVLKVLNNNAVLVCDDKKEYMLLKKSIGFNSQKGDLIKKGFIVEKMFVFLEDIKIFNAMQDFVTDVDDNLLKILDDDEYKTLEKVKNIINKEFKNKLNYKNIEYMRFEIHLKLMIIRCFKDEKLDYEFNYNCKNNFKFSYNIAIKIAKLIKEDLKVDVSETELELLSIHIQRLYKY